jgi:ribokinase
MADVTVLGQVGRDLVLRMDGAPEAGGAVAAQECWELPGGKGANQAVALAQLGVPTALVGVVGDDAAGAWARSGLAADGIDVSCVLVRPAARTALLVDLVEDGGRRRLVEDVPAGTLLTTDDVAGAGAGDQIAACQVLGLQLQQPGDAVRAALDRVPDGAMVVTDGAPSDEPTRAAVLARADVVRADAVEAGLLVGRTLHGPEEARDAAAELLTAGPRLVAMAVEDGGDLVAWRAGPTPGVAAGEQEADPRWADGEVLTPRLGGPAVDPTGAGDAYVAALTAALLGRAAPADAAWVAAAAAALAAGRLGGRPALSSAALAEMLRHDRPDQG